MNLVLASLAWIVIGAILGASIFLLVVKGSPWLLIISTVAFIAAVGKIGCATH
jgi:hypothetical protein